MISVRALAGAVEAMGVERARFLAEAGLDAARFDDLNARISQEEYDRVRRAALATTGDPALGLHMGGRPSMSSFDFLGGLAENSGSLREAFQVGVQYARVLVDGARLELHEQGDVATLRCPTLRACVEDRMTAEFVTCSLVYLLRRFGGGTAQPRRVLFSYAAPSYRDEYARVFGGRETFSHAFTGVEVDRTLLDRSHASHSAELHALLRSRGELMLARVEQTAPAAERVKRWLASNTLETKPTMDVIARDLGMSARSLRRRLTDEHAPYDELVTEARVVRAKRLLTDPAQSVQEVAYALGFDTPGAFSRAFRRWTGMAPSTYRATR